MHRAGVDRAIRHGRFRLAVVEIGFGIGGELGSAAGRAEMEGFAPMVEPVLAGRWVDGHAANGISHRRRVIGMAVIVRMVAVPMACVIVATAIGGFVLLHSMFHRRTLKYIPHGGI
jgi:hypothetical protein